MLSMTIPIPLPSFSSLIAVSRSTTVAITAVAVGMAFFWAMYFAFMVKKRREQAAAQKARASVAPKRSLFDELCQSHVLSQTEQTLLRDLTKSLGLSSPALLLVEPKHLQERAERSGDGSDVAATLLDKLFGKQLS